MSEFYIPGTFHSEQDGNEVDFHEAGLDGIAPAYDPISLLTGAIGYDPRDYDTPTVETQSDIEPKELPQWGPPFVKFVDGRMTELEKAIQKLTEKWSLQTRTDVFMASMQTTASGGLDLNTVPNCSLYEPPPGFSFALHRIIIRDAAHTFGSPYTNAASWWELRVDNEPIDGDSMISGQGQLPIVGTWGTRDALRVRDGQVLSLFMSGGPVSTTVYVLGQGSLDRTIEG